MCINGFVCVQLVELSSANSAETAAVQLQSSMTGVTQFVKGERTFVVISSVTATLLLVFSCILLLSFRFCKYDNL